jgi:hypothetical protein
VANNRKAFMSKPRVFQSILIAALALPLGLMAYLGHFSRFIADDYCTSAAVLAKGLGGSVLNWYMTYAGQFSNFTLKGIMGLIGPLSAAILPTIIIVLWSAAAIWTFFQICRVLRFRQPGFSGLLLGLLFVFVVLDGAPSITQSLYWFGASIPYTLPLTVFTFFIGYFIRVLRAEKLPTSAYIVTTVAAFLTAGLSEVYAIFQLTAMGLAAIGFYRAAPKPLQQKALRLLGTGILSSGIALVILVVAPGNAVRQAAFPDRLPLTEVAIRTLRITIAFFATDILIFAPRAILIALFGSSFITLALRPHAIAFLYPRRVRMLLGATLLGALVLFAACMAPPIYAISVAPPPRVYLLPHFVLMALAFTWGSLMTLSLRLTRPPAPRLLAGAAVLLIVIGPLYSTVKLVGEIPPFSAYAAEWDARDAAIRAAAQQGTKTYATRLLSYDIGEQAGLDIISPDGQDWVNQCAANYYGLDQLKGETGLTMADKQTGMVGNGS